MKLKMSKANIKRLERGLAPKMTEREFQKQVIALAHLHGWLVAHFRPGRVRRGGKETWETPVAADGKGFKDLVLVRDRVIFSELKSETGVMSDDQADWHSALLDADAEAYVWRPEDWAEIKRLLA